MQKELRFPKGFYWGTATAAHQVEGNNYYNDWWEWEQKRGTIKGSEKSGLACDQYNRYEEDFKLVKKLRQNAHRFSIEWSRIEPRQGKFNKEAIRHYKKVLESLLDKKITPFVTLHHFTNPLWLSKKGGWANRHVTDYFENFVEKIVEELDPYVKNWITINEPCVGTFWSYIEGKYPPGKHNIFLAFKVLKHKILAHAKAYHKIHSVSKNNPQVGFSKQVVIFTPVKNNSLLDNKLAKTFDFICNESYFKALDTGIISFPFDFNRKHEQVKDAWDFIGINYYQQVLLNPSLVWKDFFLRKIIIRGKEKFKVKGANQYPRGLYDTLIRLKKYNKPVYITENGIPTKDENERIGFITSHLKNLNEAIKQGTKVKGYFYWSLIDNFEWFLGFEPKFGLISIDLKTQKRKLKKSAYFYRKICQTNSIPNC